MVAACRAIGASLQAAVLCQSLPQPDHESAFHILQENPLVVARDAAAYFDCVWEVSMMCYSSWRLYTTTKQYLLSSISLIIYTRLWVIIILALQAFLCRHNSKSVENLNICLITVRTLQCKKLNNSLRIFAILIVSSPKQAKQYPSVLMIDIESSFP